MADLNKRLEANVAGDFFVDDSCINCDTCRQLALSVFKDDGDYSVVSHQPESEAEILAASQALMACPTASIGTLNKEHLEGVADSFPLLLEDNVYYLGFNSPKSFGANSYFIQHPEGNWLIDAPRYVSSLVEKLKKLGGVKYLFLTHRDDVADAERYTEELGCERIIHQLELEAQPYAEHVIQGFDDVEFVSGFKIIPTSGHTEGHCVLLYNNGTTLFLFTGDHMSWNRYENQLRTSKRHSWYSWEEQKRSVAKLKNYDFEWILPGHGQRIKLSRKTMKAHLYQHIKNIETL